MLDTNSINFSIKLVAPHHTWARHTTPGRATPHLGASHHTWARHTTPGRVTPHLGASPQHDEEEEEREDDDVRQEALRQAHDHHRVHAPDEKQQEARGREVAKLRQQVHSSEEVRDGHWAETAGLVVRVPPGVGPDPGGAPPQHRCVGGRVAIARGVAAGVVVMVVVVVLADDRHGEVVGGAETRQKAAAGWVGTFGEQRFLQEVVLHWDTRARVRVGGRRSETRENSFITSTIWYCAKRNLLILVYLSCIVLPNVNNSMNDAPANINPSKR